jgi:hypothetical protein
MARIGWFAWAAALVVVLIGLGWQVSYAGEVLECRSGHRLVLCSGPMPDWLMPVTVVLGLVLVVVGALRPSRRQE